MLRGAGEDIERESICCLDADRSFVDRFWNVLRLLVSVNILSIFFSITHGQYIPMRALECLVNRATSLDDAN